MKKLKKVALLAATAAMIFGATGSVVAAYDEDSIDVDSKGYADCYVTVGLNYASAETSVFANYAADSIYAYADVQLIYDYKMKEDTFAYSDWDEERVTGQSAYAQTYFTTTGSYNEGAHAISNHVAEIDGVREGRQMYVATGVVDSN